MSSSVTSESITPAFRLTSLRACLLIALLWAGIYLPGLGSLQLEHEEPRRALPALHMLASGDWLLPRVGSDPYLRKPPLLNWAIALSCRLFGGPSEWAVRLPSALATLALAIAIVAVGGGRWLGIEGGFVAAVFFLTNFTMVETGRLAELEALYVSFTGIALILWTTSWRQGVSPWLLWLLPAPFLALGMLTKGPTHLIFYYGVILPVLLFGKDVRSLGHPAHWLALALILGALLSWAIPCSFAVGNHIPVGIWRFWWDQLASRASAGSDEHFRLSTWLLNGPQTLKNYLPWTLLLPLLWRKETIARLADATNSSPRELALFRGARWGMVATAILMILLPNGSPRYIYPLIVVPCLLLGRVLILDAESAGSDWLRLIWKRGNLLFLTIVSVGIVVMPLFTPGDRWILLWTCFEAILAAAVWFFTLANRSGGSAFTLFATRSPLVACALASAVITALAMMQFVLVAIPRINSASTHRSREVAFAIRNAIPTNAQLWVLEDSYRPFWYYLEPKVTYFHRLTDLPPDADYILLPAARTQSFVHDPSWKSAPPTVIMQALDSEHKAFDLLVRKAE